MDLVVDYFLRYVTLVGVTFYEWAIDFAHYNFGAYAAFLATVLIFPVAVVLIVVGMIFTVMVAIISVILSPIILPIAVYRHRAK